MTSAFSATAPRLRAVLSGFCGALLAFACLPVRAADALPPETTELARLYRVRAAELTARYQETVKALPRQYETDLAALLDRYQKSGDLDGVLAVAREQKRFADAMRQTDRDPFEQTPEMPPSSQVAQPAELRARQDLYLRQYKDASELRQRDLADLTAKYVARLESVQRELTRAGRIRDAVIVKRESDRLSKGVTDDTLVQLVESLADELGPAPDGAGTATPPATPTGDEVPTFGSVPNWAKWRYDRVYPLARERMLLGDPDIPDELRGEYTARTGLGRFYGRCQTDRWQVGPYLCAWFGKAVVWDVDDPSTLSATLDIESEAGALSPGAEGGPQAVLAVLNGNTVIKMLNVPLTSTRATLGVFQDPGSNRCALRWLEGKVTEIFDLPEGAKVRLLLGVCVRNPGEECNTKFSFRR